nr:E3 SUMO-protein ligase NSE2-like [Onthophagus taurus]
MSSINIVDNHQQQRLMEMCVNALKICAKTVNENLEGDEKDNFLSELEDDCCHYIMEDIKNKCCKQALSLTIPEMESQENEGFDINNFYDKAFNDLIGTTKTNFNEHDFMKDFRRTVGDTRKRIEIDESLIDATQFHVPVDPITKLSIRNPWRNKICQHIFDKDTIYSYLDSKKSIKCPYIGCTNTKLCLNDMVLDQELLQKILNSSGNVSNLNDTANTINVE